MENSRPVALVTGAASNIGLACARAFAKDYTVVLADIQDTSDVAKDIGSGSVYVVGDLSKKEDCLKMVAAAEKLGPLTCLVHSAGVTGPATAIDEMALEEWERLIRINLTGSFLIAQSAIPAMRRSGQGAMVLITSRAAKTGFAALGTHTGGTKAHYCASKAGLISLTKSLAVELAGDNIRVNGIAPGPIEGTMIPREKWNEISAKVPLGRLGLPDEIAASARFLCTPDAGFITGHILDVNGGTLMD